MNWNTDRREPYTVIGVRRVPCIRCGGVAKYQWQICSDGNRWRPVCERCDVALNRLVLEFMRHPDPEGAIARYEARKTV